MPLGVVQHLLVGPPSGSLHPGGQPVQAHRLAGTAHLRKPLAQVVEAGDEGSVGLTEPSAPSRPSSRSRLSPTSVLEMPTMRPARRYDSPSRMTAATASKRTSRASGGVPPLPGGRD